MRFASGGEAGYKQWALQRFLNDPRQNDRAINVASAYAFAGNRDRALQFLRKAYPQGDPRLKMLRAYPQYWFLYGDAEYNSLPKTLGQGESTKWKTPRGIWSARQSSTNYAAR